MKIDTEQVLCRFQLPNVAKHGLTPLYQWIVGVARRDGLQGTTVLEGLYGLGARGEILRPTRALVQHLPVIVEVVDTTERIAALLAKVEPVFTEGVITLERAHVLLYRAGEREATGSLTGRNILGTVHTSAAEGVRTMTLPENGVLLRVFIGESDKDRESGGPLYQSIVHRAREAHLAGATVLRGSMGFGRHSRVHSARMLELSFDLPIVIEIVDAEDKIDAFLPVVDHLVSEGLVTLEGVRIIKYVSPESRGEV